MKKIISLVVLFSVSITAQTLPPKSLAELKQISQSSLNYPATSIQNPVSSILNPETERKSPGLAILYSFLLPGMGELYAGDYSSGKYYTIADGILWGTFAGFEIYANNQMSNYKSFARANAAAMTDGKEADYFANVGIYPSIDEYNTAMLLNRNFDRTYNPATHYWNWINPDQRKEYRNMWTSSESAFTNVRFVVGALILNRVISVINAVRTVSAYNKNLNREVSWNIYFGVENNAAQSQSLTLNIISSF